jgi:IclR family KDG regulon transcriptional repressor
MDSRDAMKAEFKRVPALDKCFSILEYLTEKKSPSSMSELSEKLNLNKSTVYNILHTLTDLGVLENSDNRFRFGPKLYVFGKAAENSSDLIRTIHPHLKQLSQKTGLSAFLGMRSGARAIIVDKVDASFDLRVSSEIGLHIPLFTGAHGKSLMSLLPDEEIDRMLAEKKVLRSKPFSSSEKKEFKEAIKRVREEGIALDDEEYIEGIRALAVPLEVSRKDLKGAIWVVGLKKQIPDDRIPEYSTLLKETIQRIENQF